MGRLRVDLNPRRVSMAFTDFPYQIEEIGSGSLEVKVVFNPGDPPGEAPITVEFTGLYGRHGEGRIRGDGSWIRTPAGQALDLRILAEGVDMAPDLGEAIGHLGEEAKEIWDRLNPSGGANVMVAIQRDPDGELRHQIEVDLLGSALNTRDERVQLEDITGHLTLNSEGLKIRDLKCKHGGGWILANGEAKSVESRFSGSLRIEFNTMNLDEAFRRLLPEEAHAIYDRFQPSGEVSGVVELQLQPEGEAVRFTEIRIYPQGARILYDACPYPVDQLRGEVRVDVETGRISIPGLFAALEGGGEAIIRGEVLMNGSAAEMDLRVAFTGIPLDETLRWAISEGGQAIWDQLDPGGRVKGEMRVTRKRNGPLIIQGDLKLMDATARPVDFPLRVRGLEGTVRVDLVIPEGEPLRGTVTLGGDGPIRGRREEAVVLITGDLDLRDGETTGNVRVQAMDLRVDPVLRGALPPEAREKFDSVEPRGWADVDVVLEFESGKVSVEWEARARDLRMRYRDFPIPIYGVQGLIRSRGDGVEIVGVRGHIGKDATIEVSGTSTAGGEVLQLWIRANRLPLVERVRKLLPASVAETWSDLGLEGEADLDLRIRLEGGVFLILAEAEARGMSISFGPEGLRFDDLTGRLQGTATVFLGGPSTGRAEVEARISNVAGAFKERRIEDLSTNLWYRRGAGKNAKGELSYRDIHGKIIGGLLTGNIWLELGEELKYRGHLHLVDGRLERALATHEKSKNATGKLAAELDFHGTGGDPESTSGWGKVEIRKGDFLEIPAISSLPVELTDQKTFDEMTINFNLGATEADVDLVLSSKVLSLIGRGTVGYDGSLDIVM
ncbi:MAG: hypothetical protein O6952_03185, partial [Planctomycetota bacterium]|nr:hypothetical protein [Planctomycetota bacterium]